MDDHGLRTLVVDDDPGAAAALGSLLRLLGCQTHVATNAAAGLRLAETLQPSLVFLDLHIPVSDACLVLGQAREIKGAVRDALFVCLSSSFKAANEAHCLAAGFHHFIRKPVELRVFAALVEMARKRRCAG